MLGKFTLGTVGEFGWSGNARVHSKDIRGVHGVPQIQTERGKKNRFNVEILFYLIIFGLFI